MLARTIRPWLQLPKTLARRYATDSMGVKYHIKFYNKTDTAWHWGVYQKFPTFPGLSVVWKVRRLPPQSNSDVNFTLDYGTALTNWDANDKAWTGQQFRRAELGKVYQAKFDDVDIPSIDTTPIKNASEKDQIDVKNNTTSVLNIGFTLDGDLLVTKNVQGGATANFEVHPTYYIALYHSIKQGQMVDSGVQLGPVELEFKNGFTNAVVEAVNMGGTLTLKPPKLVPN